MKEPARAPYVGLPKKRVQRNDGALMWYLYILLCQDGSLYTGITVDVEKRFNAHQTGKGGAFTRSHKPIKIVYTEEFINRSTALKREIEIKKFSHIQKEELIREGISKKL